MKRRCIAFALMLCAVMLMKLGLPVVAEMTRQTNDGYTRDYVYCEGIEAPVSASIVLPVVTGEETQKKEKEFSFSSQYNQGGQLARALVQYVALDREMTDADWLSINDHLALVISGAVPSAGGMDADVMAESILSALIQARTAAAADENGVMPLYADAQIQLSSITVSAPYYPELSRGARGVEVKTLQQRLIDLGYLDGKADGQFGKITAAAIEDVEKALRDREQAVIDAMPTPVPTPVPTPTPIPSPAAVGAPEDTEQPAEAEAVPVVEPSTRVDGVADLAFQIRLYSDEFPLVDGALDKGSDASAVVRLQRRLVALGTLTDKPDGDYGGNTRRAVHIFQHYNGLEKTGIADEGTQRALFSTAAKAPDNPLMTLGSESDAVKKLQKQLILTGFMSGTADGSYGAGTKTAIERLQKYMRNLEIEELTRKARSESASVPAATPAQAGATAGDGAQSVALNEITVTPTIEVNGVADPLLLDAFYASTFPTVPSALKNGDETPDVERMQRRLFQLEYIYTSPDGTYGNATENAVRDFQKRNAITQDGVAGSGTMNLLFSDDALKALKPYVLKVSTSKQRVYAYGLDENNEHTVLVRTMKCSTGLNSTPTPKGTYQGSTGPGARWHYFKKFTCWAQYAYYIQGDYMFHSVLYNQKNGAVTSSSVRNLGSKASHGCVRLKVEDAKWIYQNCPKNTKVVVY